MQQRRVIVTLELECCTSLELLNKAWWWQEILEAAGFRGGKAVHVIQAQANSMRSLPSPKAGAKKRRHA